MRRAASWSLLLLLLSCGEGGDSPPLCCDAGPPVRPDAAPIRPTSTTLVVTITEGAGGPPIPGRVVLTDEAGNPVRIGYKDMYNGIEQDQGFCDMAPGVIGTWDGIAIVDGTGEMAVGDSSRCTPRVAIPYGRYHLTALQGIEHELYETDVDLTEDRGKVTVVAPLARVFTPTGALAADLHVHAFGSGDSNVPREVRVQSELVTGIKVMGASDHNLNSTYDDEIALLGLTGKIAAIGSNEASGSNIHANVFPVVINEADPPTMGAPRGEDIGGLPASEFFAALHALPRAPWVQLNHPRLRFAAYFDAAGWDGRSWPPPMPLDFDGVETVTGWYAYDLPGDERLSQAVQDFFTLIQHGKLVTATGNSDTHHLSSILAGMPRNYVFVDDTSLAPLDEDRFVEALRGRRVVATTGPWLELSVGGATTGGQTSASGGMVHAGLTLRQASYVKATRMRLWVGGMLRAEVAIPAGATEWSWSGDVGIGAFDTSVAVTVDGTEFLPPALHGEYLGHRPDVPGMVPFAIANPVLVDADGDGKWNPPASKPAAAAEFFQEPWRPEFEECAPPGAW